MPNFTSENVLRICMQFQDVNQTKSKGLWESYRWVLNYTFPNEFTNFTTQMMPPVKLVGFDDWCTRPHNWTKILPFDANSTTGLPAPASKTTTPAKGKRQLEEFS